MLLDKDKFKHLLPQRDPFLFIDEVIEVEEGQRVVAKKYLDPEEDYFKGHFPGNPVMPGVLTIEAMAQTAILLYATTKSEIAKTNPDYYLASVNAILMAPAYPGDTLILEAMNFKMTDVGAVIDITSKIGNKLIAKTRISFAVKAKK